MRYAWAHKLQLSGPTVHFYTVTKPRHFAAKPRNFTNLKALSCDKRFSSYSLGQNLAHHDNHLL